MALTGSRAYADGLKIFHANIFCTRVQDAAWRKASPCYSSLLGVSLCAFTLVLAVERDLSQLKRLVKKQE